MNQPKIEKKSKPIKGGARPGAGRKAGVRNKRTEKTIREVEASGLTPLQFMLEVMRSDAPDTEDAMLILQHRALRMDAAKAAAPYVHPKLTAIEHSGGVAVQSLAQVLSEMNERHQGSNKPVA